MNVKTSAIKIFSLIMLILLCGSLTLLNSSLYAQTTTETEEGTFEFRQWFSEKLNYTEFKNNDSYDFIWIDENTLLYREYRQLNLVRNILSPKPETVTLTSFLMAEDDSNVSSFFYVPKREVLVFVEEMPEPIIKMYNKNGEFVDYLLLEEMNKNTFKMTYIKDKDTFLILADTSLIFCKSWNEYEVLAENIVSYIYNQNSSEILLFTKSFDTFDISMMNMNDRRKKLTPIAEKIIYANYYPKTKLITYVKTNDGGKKSLYTVSYYEQYDTMYIKEPPKLIQEKISYHRYDYTQFKKQQFAFEYVPMEKIFIVMNDNTDNSRYLQFIKNNGEVITTIENVFDFIYSPITGDVITISNTEKDNEKQLMYRNMSNLVNPVLINQSAQMMQENDLQFDEMNSIISFFNNEGNLILYSVNENKSLLDVKYADKDEDYYINPLSNQYIMASYIDNTANEPITTYYSIKTKKKFDIENAYIGTAQSSVVFSILEQSENGLQLSIYLDNKFANRIEEDFREQEIAIYHFSLGLKAGGMLTFLTGAKETTFVGFEFSLFFDYIPFQYFFVEGDITYARRNFSFDPQYASGEVPLLVESIVVHSNVFSIQLFANLSYPITNDIKLYLLLGGRFNYFFNNVLERQMSTGGETSESFNSEINQGNGDLSFGIGSSFLNTNKLGLSIEFVAYFSVISPFKESYLIELYNQTIYPVELQINVNFIFYKF